MPELPEVETIKLGLQKFLVGKKILEVWTDSPKQLKPSLSIIKENTVGSTIEKIDRRAKLLQIYLSNGKILAVHLKLTGRLIIRKNEVPQDEWQHAIFKLSDEWELRFCDLRKFGYLKLLNSEKELDKLLAEFGPEPFVGQKPFSGQALLTLELFKKIVSSSKIAIKQLLMDQKKIGGIGNIYACEALFSAKINPERPAKKMTDEEMKNLYESIGKVLKLGLKYRGASDQYYVDAQGQKGSYQNHFLVYGRKGEKCWVCGGIIQKIKLGGRGTYFCPQCQK